MLSRILFTSIIICLLIPVTKGQRTYDFYSGEEIVFKDRGDKAVLKTGLFRNEIYFVLTNKDLFLKIIVGSIPTMIVGYTLVKYDLIDQLRSIETIGWTTLIFGILMYFSDKFKNKKNLKFNFNYKAVFFIGLMQILSLIPGVSRSGVTITAARFLNF